LFETTRGLLERDAVLLRVGESRVQLFQFLLRERSDHDPMLIIPSTSQHRMATQPF